jgi:hypothetical protein
MTFQYLLSCLLVYILHINHLHKNSGIHIWHIAKYHSFGISFEHKIRKFRAANESTAFENYLM